MPGVVGAVKGSVPPPPDTRMSNRLFSSAVTVWLAPSLLTMVSCWPGLTDAGTVKAKLEITISLPAAWAVVELGADVDGIWLIEDCPLVLAGADGDDDWLVPPHAVSTAAESRNDEISIAMRLMVLLP